MDERRYKDEEFVELPRDWQHPDWNSTNRVHEWKNYISMRVAAMWETFTDEQKKALALQADNQAGNENWD